MDETQVAAMITSIEDMCTMLEVWSSGSAPEEAPSETGQLGLALGEAYTASHDLLVHLNALKAALSEA